MALARSNYWKWHRGGGKGGKKNANGALSEKLKDAISEVEKKITAVTDETSQAVTKETGQAVTDETSWAVQMRQVRM